ncbi:MAG: penicillin-binding protein activator LpoB [Spirochaetia bacterium]
MKILKILCVLMIGVAFIGCKTTKVSRISTEETTDLSGRWNDTDARLVAEEMVKDALSRPWLTNYVQDQGRKPVVIVGTVRNKSSEHIETLTFIKNIERELINSGEVKFVASKMERKEIRGEREDQQSWASEETAKRLAAETGADFMMQGVITSITDAVQGKKVVYYQVNMELVNLETTEKVWIGEKKIKKYIERSGVKW